MRSVTSNQDYRQYYQGSESVIHAPKGIAFFGGAFVMILIAFIATLYISSYLLPLMVVVRSFYVPVIFGVAIPASIIGALMLVLSGSVGLAVALAVSALVVTVLIGGLSGNRRQK